MSSIMSHENQGRREVFRKWAMFWISLLFLPAITILLITMDARTEQTIRRMDYIGRMEWSAKWEAHDKEVNRIIDGLKQSYDQQAMRIAALEGNRDALNALAVKVARVEAVTEDIRETVRQMVQETKRQNTNTN